MLFPDKLTYTAALDTPAEERSKYLMYRDSINALDRSIYIDLQEGNYLITQGASIKLSVSDYDDSDYYTYSAPEGIVVPLGTYIVGEEIPAGSYTAYPYYLEGAKIIIYKNAEALAAEKFTSLNYDADTVVYLGITNNSRSSIFKLNEGNVVIIENAVVMTKNAAFDFGN